MEQLLVWQQKKKWKFFAELELQYYAHSRLLEANIQLDGSSYKELLQEFQEYERKSMSFWRAIHKRLAVPWAWVLRIDVANGPIM